MNAHMLTDPACIHYREPRTIVELEHYDRNRGIPCPVCFPDDQPLMQWRRRRMPRAAHVALMLAVAAIVGIAGVELANWLIPDDTLIVAVAVMWGVIVGVSAVAYWEEVIDR